MDMFCTYVYWMTRTRMEHPIRIWAVFMSRMRMDISYHMIVLTKGWCS